MPRPPKCRRVCAVPHQKGFLPLQCSAKEQIVMTVEEYETIRLISLEGCTQEQCARQMQIARTTVQSIYMSAKTKMADALVNGKSLIVKGGNYALCAQAGCGCCRKRCGGANCGDSCAKDDSE
ncbi:MAG: DUF134 domain-containing protein [Butyricicoccaceae bacterium]